MITIAFWIGLMLGLAIALVIGYGNPTDTRQSALDQRGRAG